MNSENIKQIIDRWDPIGLLTHAPEDEYDPEIREIKALLDSGADVNALAEGIAQIFTHAFGSDVFLRSRPECMSVAQKIVAEASPIRLIGVYPVAEEENTYLIELWISVPPRQVNLSQFYQQDPQQKETNWQVPYDESYLNPEGTEVLGDFFNRNMIPGEESRLAFFIYTENRNLSLNTPWGEISLAETKPMPKRLQILDLSL